jgi:hypothetical protein
MLPADDHPKGWHPDWDHPDRLIRTRAKLHDKDYVYTAAVLDWFMAWFGYDSLYDSRHQ